MVAELSPYLSFKDNARQALEFYADVLGGTLALSTFAEFGQADGPAADLIMHGRIEAPDGMVLMAADTPPGQEHNPGSAYAVSLSGDDDSLRTKWEALSSGGTVLVPFEKQMWGDEFGMCIDKFGVQWMVNVTAGSGG